MVAELQWTRDYYRALTESAADKRPILADFTAAPM
jgi:hypothetical protein